MNTGNKVDQLMLYIVQGTVDLNSDTASGNVLIYETYLVHCYKC